jgi:hypothetical protein
MKVSRKAVLDTLTKSGWPKHTRTSTNVRGYWHDNAGWKVSNAKAGEPIIIWHIKENRGNYEAPVGERLSSYAHELRKAGFAPQIKSNHGTEYIKIER